VISTNNRNLNDFHGRNMPYSYSASATNGHQISWDFYALERFLLGLEHHLPIHKNYTQSAVCFSFLFDFDNSYYSRACTTTNCEVLFASLYNHKLRARAKGEVTRKTNSKSVTITFAVIWPLWVSRVPGQSRA